MRKRTIVAFALLASLMLATMPTAGALKTNTVVPSNHNTASELSNAKTLDNVSVEGSGQTGHLNYSSGRIQFSDGFEDESTDAGLPDAWQAEATGAKANVSTNRARSGTQSMYLEASGTKYRVNPDTHPLSDRQTTFVNVSFYSGTVSNGGPIVLQLEDGSTRYISLQLRNGDLATFDGSSWNTITTDVDAGEWAHVHVHNIDPAADTFDVYWEEDGGATSGESTGLSMRNDMPAGGYTQLQVGSGGDWAYYDDVVINGSRHSQGTYISQNHTVERSTQGFVNISQLSNAKAIVTFEGSTDGGPWSQLAKSTYTTTGNKTLTWSTATADRVRTNITFVNQSSGAAGAEVFDEGVQFTARQPVVDNSSMQPRGELSSQSASFEIDVNDSDFPLSQGDSVTAELFVDGNSRGTDTLSSNGTATVMVSGLTGGNHSYHWEASDSYGLSNTSTTRDVRVPANITIRNVTEPHQIIKDSEATILIAGSDETVDKQQIPNGNISLEGLPVNETYVALVNSTNYHQRAVIVKNIYNQSSIFLLNKTFHSEPTTIAIDDLSGDYPPGEVTLSVERIINRSIYDPNAKPKYQWTVVGGDRLAADQRYFIELEHGARYRIVAENAQGDRRILGEYVANEPGDVILTIGKITWKDPDGDVYKWEARQQKDGKGGEEIVVQYTDKKNKTSKFCVTVHERGNTSNELYPQDCATDLGTYKTTIPLSASDENVSWVANWSASRGGEDIGYADPVTSIRGIGIPIDEKWLTIILLPALVGLLSAAPKTEARGGAALVTLVASGASLFGWVPIALPALGVMGALSVVGMAAEFNKVG